MTTAAAIVYLIRDKKLVGVRLIALINGCRKVYHKKPHFIYSRLPISNPRAINRIDVEVPYLGG